MRIAVVLPELDATAGGGFSFQAALHGALRELEGEIEHELVYLVPETTAGGPYVRMRMDARAHLARAAIRLVRDAQDRALGMERRLDRATDFERLLEDHSIELVWFSTPWAADCDQPYFFTHWDMGYREQPWFPELSGRGEFARRDRLLARYVPGAARVITPNPAGTEELLRRIPLAPGRVLELAHPTPPFALEAAEGDPVDRGVAERAGGRGRYLLYPAQFWPHKNHPTLLRALAQLDGYHAVLVGSDKGARGRVQALAADLGVSDRVSFPGFVETEELVALYQHAHALAYPSFLGPENLPPLEAMALGCPAVVADVPGAEHQLGDAALRFDPPDHEALAAAIRSLEDASLRERHVDAGRTLAAGRTARSYVQGVLAAVDELAAAGVGS